MIKGYGKEAATEIRQYVSSHKCTCRNSTACICQSEVFYRGIQRMMRDPDPVNLDLLAFGFSRFAYNDDILDVLLDYMAKVDRQSCSGSLSNKKQEIYDKLKYELGVKKFIPFCIQAARFQCKCWFPEHTCKR